MTTITPSLYPEEEKENDDTERKGNPTPPKIPSSLTLTTSKKRKLERESRRRKKKEIKQENTLSPCALINHTCPEESTKRFIVPLSQFTPLEIEAILAERTTEISVDLLFEDVEEEMGEYKIEFGNLTPDDEIYKIFRRFHQSPNNFQSLSKYSDAHDAVKIKVDSWCRFTKNRVQSLPKGFYEITNTNVIHSSDHVLINIDFHLDQ